MRYKPRREIGPGCIAAGSVIIVALILAIALMLPVLCGVGYWGPERSVTATVQRTYVDVSGSKDNTSSHYMVVTDAGVFEVDNSLLMGIWNADELYAALKAGETYILTTRGNKVTTWYMQEYPLIVNIERMEP